MDAGGHVHQLAHGSVAERRHGQFGHVLSHLAGGVELTFGHQKRRQCAGKGLGNRHGGMLPLGLQHAEVALIHHPPSMENDDPIGVIGLKRRFPGHWRATPKRDEGQRIDAFARVRFKHGGLSQTA